MITQRLAEIAPPPARTGVDSFKWSDFEREIGVRLPGDYKELVDTYGPGQFGGFVYICQPDSNNKFLDLVSENRGWLTALRDLKESGEFIPYKLDSPSELFACGYEDNGDPIFWRRNSTDPEEWNIVVMEARGCDRYEFKGGLVDFLIECLTGRVRVPVFPDDFPGEEVGFVPLCGLSRG